MKMSRPELNIVNIGDIHLLHRLVTSAFIIDNLDTVFTDPVETPKIDMICFTGDIFDTRGSLSDPAVPRIQEWIARVLKMAKKHDILVRVLEGTPLHDWKQSQLWESINAIADIGADLKYVKTVSVEYIERYGITMLYVPDEANPSTEKTLSQVRELLRAKGLDQVDFAMMHGQFDYQLDVQLDRHKTHDSDAYLALVREIIMIGHVHTYSRHDRIIAPGSFDRLAQGQEEAKGHVRICARQNGEYDVEFRENLGAKRFVNVPCKGLDLAQTNAQIDKYVKDLPVDSYVRIEADVGNPILMNMQQVMLRHPAFNWSKIARKEKKAQEEATERVKKDYQFVSLTKDNLGDMLLKRVVDTEPSPAVLEAARRLIGEVL
jgi:DNA repair exonuclease SbcCD nuclease subunit